MARQPGQVGAYRKHVKTRCRNCGRAIKGAGEWCSECKALPADERAHNYGKPGDCVCLRCQKVFQSPDTTHIRICAECHRKEEREYTPGCRVCREPSFCRTAKGWHYE